MLSSKTSNSPEVDWNQAAALAWWCCRLYDNPPDGFDYYIGYRTVLCGVVQHPDALYVVFQGTNEWADWGINTRVIPQRVGRVLVHRGFYETAAALAPQIPHPGSRPLVLAGHSLGGALAVLVGWLLAHHQPVVYTYGQPKIGNRGLARVLTRVLPRYYRFHYENDIVPLLPVGPHYTHAGRVFYVGRNGYVVEWHRPRLGVAVRQLLGLAEHALLRRGLHAIESHRIDYYAKALTVYAQTRIPARQSGDPTL